MTARDLTREAAQGFDWQTRRHPGEQEQPADACPYLATSPAAMAWHLGRHLAAGGDERPTPVYSLREPTRIAVAASRGDTLSVRGYCDTLLARYRWHDDNTFTEERLK